MSEHERFPRFWPEMDNTARISWLKEQVDKLTIAPAKAALESSLAQAGVGPLTYGPAAGASQAIPPGRMGASGIDLGNYADRSINTASRSPEEDEKTRCDWLMRCVDDFLHKPSAMYQDHVVDAMREYQTAWMAGRRRITVSD